MQVEFTGVDGTPTREEVEILCRLVTERQPKRLFEIGTFRGQTTLNLARRAPDGAIVYTLDLPPDQGKGILPHAGDTKYVERQKGACFAGWSGAAKVVQLLGDSALFDFAPYVGQIDFVWIDACHSFEACLSDSLHALTMVRPGGLIVWHDYSPRVWPGVAAALDSLRVNSVRFQRMKFIAPTTLALLEC